MQWLRTRSVYSRSGLWEGWSEGPVFHEYSLGAPGTAATSGKPLSWRWWKFKGMALGTLCHACSLPIGQSKAHGSTASHWSKQVTWPNHFPLAKASHMAKPKVKGPGSTFYLWREELQMHIIRGVDSETDDELGPTRASTTVSEGHLQAIQRFARALHAPWGGKEKTFRRQKM